MYTDKNLDRKMRVGDFAAHLLSNHGVEKGSMQLELYKLGGETPLERMARLPQFNHPGMMGMAMRLKSTDGQRAAGRRNRKRVNGAKADSSQESDCT